MSRPLPISFDANAAEPVHPAAWEAYVAASAHFADPSAVHGAGQAARLCLEAARCEVAAFLGAQPDEIVFTSGGTEADGLALGGVIAGLPPGAHAVVSTLEHPAVLGTVEQLRQRRGLATTFVRADRDGRVAARHFLAALTPATRLVALMLASNETGVVQPVVEVAAACRRRGVFMHTDAVQAVGKMPVNVRELGVDLLAIAGHKLGAVAGIGALYVRRGVHLAAQVPGSQEGGRRGGVENVPGAASLAAALRHAPSTGEIAALAARRGRFEAGLRARLPGIEILGERVARLPNTSCVRFSGCEADGLLMAPDLQGFAVSTGSACSSGSIEPSTVLLGMGLTAVEARQTVRFSLSHQADDGQVDRLLAGVTQIVARMREA